MMTVGRLALQLKSARSGSRLGEIMCTVQEYSVYADH